MEGRPEVRWTVPLPVPVVLAAFERSLSQPGCPCRGFAGRREVTLRVGDARHRAWSPWLQLEVREASDGLGTELSGVMGPRPELWTAFVFVYAALCAVTLGGAVYGGVQANLGWAPTGFGATAVGLAGLGMSCGTDLVGRRLGRGQMGILRGFAERTLDEAGARPDSSSVGGTDAGSALDGRIPSVRSARPAKVDSLDEGFEVGVAP